MELTAHTIIAGFGLPGRAAAEVLASRGLPYCVIEMNAQTVTRCERGGTPIIAGDCRNPQVLQRAGIANAKLVAILIPGEKAALEATRQARRLNPDVRIITRCHYTSSGIEAQASGANQVIVAEQVVAAEASQRIAAELGRGNP
jgi:voltage-gated potassium channel Kch